MEASFRGKPYRVTFSKLPPDRLGQCDFNRGKIKVSKALRGLALMDTEVHEALHACFPDLCEEAVEESARDITSYLWRRGYRLTLI
jgi:hypothetical protein